MLLVFVNVFVKRAKFGQNDQFPLLTYLAAILSYQLKVKTNTRFWHLDSLKSENNDENIFWGFKMRAKMTLLCTVKLVLSGHSKIDKAIS